MKINRDVADALRELVCKGGPSRHEFQYVSDLFAHAAHQLQIGQSSRSQWDALLDSLGAPFDEQSLQGFARKKPHGYPGDYEIIDRIHCSYTNPSPEVFRWDLCFHAQPATRAVRNRKQYLASTLRKYESRTSEESVHVLNVGSGPARDILEYLNSFPQSRCRFLCVDHDPNAIRYAQTLCRSHYPSKVEFIQKNAFRFKSDQKFHIIWSAGLFDYLDNRLFIALLKRLAAFLKPGGQIIIGNFSQNNPTRAYMEMVGNWFLHHRTSEELFELARAAGYDNPALSIHTEPTRINLFLHID